MGELIGSVSAGLLFGISIRFFVTLFPVIYSFLSVFFFLNHHCLFGGDMHPIAP